MLGLTHSRTATDSHSEIVSTLRQNSRLALAVNHRLTHVAKGRSESRNHNKRNLITVIKQEKGKHRRALMPGHLKCLRSENIFAHKAL